MKLILGLIFCTCIVLAADAPIKEEKKKYQDPKIVKNEKKVVIKSKKKISKESSVIESNTGIIINGKRIKE